MSQTYFDQALECIFFRICKLIYENNFFGKYMKINKIKLESLREKFSNSNSNQVLKIKNFDDSKKLILE